MTTKINPKGKIEFDLIEFIECLDAESQISFIETLSCFDSIIKHVMDQVLTGWTENLYNGSDYDSNPEKNSIIGKARERITSQAIDELKDREIERLKLHLGRSQKEEKKYSDWAWEMYRSWGKQPRPPEFSK
jgi:hypothetical protein